MAADVRVGAMVSAPSGISSYYPLSQAQFLLKQTVPLDSAMSLSMEARIREAISRAEVS